MSAAFIILSFLGPERLCRRHERLLAGAEVCFHHRLGCPRLRKCFALPNKHRAKSIVWGMSAGLLEGIEQPAPVRRQFQPQARVHRGHAGARMNASSRRRAVLVVVYSSKQSLYFIMHSQGLYSCFIIRRC